MATELQRGRPGDADQPAQDDGYNGVSHAAAAHIGSLPRVSSLVATLLGVNPIQHLLASLLRGGKPVEFDGEMGSA